MVGWLDGWLVGARGCGEIQGDHAQGGVVGAHRVRETQPMRQAAHRGIGCQHVANHRVVTGSPRRRDQDLHEMARQAKTMPAVDDCHREFAGSGVRVDREAGAANQVTLVLRPRHGDQRAFADRRRVNGRFQQRVRQVVHGRHEPRIPRVIGEAMEGRQDAAFVLRADRSYQHLLAVSQGHAGGQRRGRGLHRVMARFHLG
jgi:hypothetical protein